jgi:two-component system, NtrC family, response regulator AtoC
MNQSADRLLIVDDDAAACDALREALCDDFVVRTAKSGPAALEELENWDADVVITDLSMDDMDGIDLCVRIRASRPEVPVIVVTGYGSMDRAVASLRAGAYDFVTKPIDAELLRHSIRRAIEQRSLRREVKRLRNAASRHAGLGGMQGESPAMQKLINRVARVAPTNAAVLVIGESGTGKELVARALHAESERREGLFVAVNCAAMTESILESELFGHVRGAFTDARANRAGLLVQADGGTLFLDEVGEMPLAMQSKLLRALQEKKVRPVGADDEVEYDARLVCATNRDLESDVEQGRFRRDLYYRINVVQIDMPPLRARGNDVLLLAQHFLKDAAARHGKAVVGIAHEAAQRILEYGWPGNVRELANCIDGAVALTSYDSITLEDLPAKVRNHHPDQLVSSSSDPADLITLAELERRYVTRVLKILGDNKTQAAKILGIERRTLYRKLERHENGRGNGHERILENSSETSGAGNY